MRTLGRLLTGATVLLAPGAVGAQEQAPAPTHLYVATYNISYADLEEWNRVFNEAAVPILEELQAEGVITGWGNWQHDTGGEYNSRFTISTVGWAAMGTFWDEYLARMGQREPEAFAATMAMIRAHDDRIWNWGVTRTPDDGSQPAILYDARFQVPLADMEEWNGLWMDVAGPILDQAMAEGLLWGWATFEHNTGGPESWRVAWLFNEWDAIDDVLQRLIGTMMTEHPDVWSRFGDLIQSHSDDIWLRVPGPDGM